MLIFDESLQEFCCINNPGNHFLSGSSNSFPYKGFKYIIRVYFFRALYFNCNFYAVFDVRSYTIHDTLSYFGMAGKKNRVQLDVISLQPCQVPGDQVISFLVKDFMSPRQVVFRAIGMRMLSMSTKWKLTAIRH